MAKLKIYPKRKTFAAKDEKTTKNQLSIEDFKDVTQLKPREFLLNSKNIGNAIMECLIDNDPAGVIEVISIYLHALNKEKFREKAEIGKSTYYYLMKSKNPTIKTLAKIVHSIAA